MDVKARSKQERALKLRFAFGALAVSSGLVLGLMVFWKGGEFVLEKYVYSNPALSIQEIRIETDGIIPIAQILQWANVKKGESTLKLDLARVKRDLELTPLIQSAFVERILPNRVVIRVSEREPIAKVYVFQPRPGDGLLESTTYYLDEQGMVIPPVLRNFNAPAFDAATKYLPALTGINSLDLRTGFKVQSAHVLAALRWIRAFQKSEMSSMVDIRSIDLSSEHTLLVRTEQGNDITFSLDDYQPMLARWRKVHEFAIHQRLSIAALDLAVTNYVPAVWVQSTNSAPAGVRPNNSPYKKRNV